MVKKHLLSLSFGVLFLLIVATGWILGTRVYLTMERAKEFLTIEHPEFIPTSEFLRSTSLGHDNAASDTLWLTAVRYVGTYAYGEYKRYLAQILMTVTEVAPQWTDPYRIWLLLLSNHAPTDSEEDRQRYFVQAEKLGLRGIQNTCRKDVVAAVMASGAQYESIWNDPLLQEPCEDGLIPGYLAFTYYDSQRDGENASRYYLLSSLHDDAPKAYRSISVLMRWRSGDRMTSARMYLLLWNPRDEELLTFRDRLFTVLPVTSTGLTVDFMMSLETVIPLLQGLTELSEADSMTRDNILRSVRELQLGWIESADTQFFQREKRHATNAQELAETNFLAFTPTYPMPFDREVQYVYDTKKGWIFRPK